MTDAGRPRRVPDRPGVGETLSAAAALLRDHPRETMLPLLVIQAILTLGVIVLTVLLYTSVFAGDAYPQGGIFGAEGRRGIFVLVVVVATGATLSLVAQAATILSVAGIARGQPLTLAEAFEPAFNRLGGLIALTVIFAIAGVLLAITIVGLALLPFLLARFGVVYQVYLLEQTDPVEAFQRSWRTMDGNMLRLLGVMLVGLALALLIGLLVPVSPEPGSLSRGARMVIDALLQILQGGMLIPVAAFAHAAVTLYYLRIREEAP